MAGIRRQRLAVAVVGAVVLIAGCSPVQGRAQPAAAQVGSAGVTTPGMRTPGVTTPGVTTPPNGTEPCDDITIGDPWIAFEPKLGARATLDVGDRGWLPGGAVDDVTVTGDSESVELTAGQAATEIRCGVVTNTAHWIEVTAVAPGTVRLTVGGQTSEITVR